MLACWLVGVLMRRHRTAGVVIHDLIVELNATAKASVNPYDPGNSIGPVEACYPPEGGEVSDIALTIELADGRELLTLEGESDIRAALGNDATDEILASCQEAAEDWE